MSLYCAQVGEIIIKPEFRKDFGHLFREEYNKIGSGIIANFLEKHKKDELIPLREWIHCDYIDEWIGKYKTSYNEETGFLTYGVHFNQHGFYASAMWDMLHLLDEITGEEISWDSWDENDES